MKGVEYINPKNSFKKQQNRLFCGPGTVIHPFRTPLAFAADGGRGWALMTLPASSPGRGQLSACLSHWTRNQPWAARAAGHHCAREEAGTTEKESGVLGQVLLRTLPPRLLLAQSPGFSPPPTHGTCRGRRWPGRAPFARTAQASGWADVGAHPLLSVR